MHRFNERQIAYLDRQILGRIATADARRQPHVTPVGFRFNPETGTIDVGGYDLESTRKVRDIRQNPRVSFVVDDLESTNPWRPRGITIRGKAEICEDPDSGNSGPLGGTWIRIFPERVVSWGLDETEAPAS